MNSRKIKTWAWVHKWSSLVCTVFMLLLCITGLPLIFHHEIGHLLGTEVESPKMPANTPRVSLDRVLETARAKHPDRVVQFVSQPEDDDGLWFVTLTPTPAPTDDFKSVAVDARTGAVLAQPKLDEGFMYVMFKLHVDLFAGLAGKLFLGFMGLLLLVAIVSGVVLYAPFMRKLDFGTVRREKRPRLKWLDLHNLLGIVTLVWLFVVGSTGMINTWADLVIKYWQYDQLSALLAPYKDEPTVPVAQRASVQRSMEVALQQTPGMKLSFVAFPGTAFSSPHHTTFFMRGSEPFTSKLLQPVLVDAKTAQVTAAPKMPWYLTALLVSQPLHFGDYGGMPMQIIWALLDIATIIVLGSGLYLWLKRGNSVPAAASPVGQRPPHGGHQQPDPAPAMKVQA
ncbi:PepSY-associated TM helix domain-containing protein [Variovorax sp. V59]|uniref:Iron-regulated membrane protein n=2 Tax=Variovorax TaxID=34072 RepID=A0AAE3XR84_VARPD|nr:MULTISPECIES: PepSY domain-containing protein [Variovorax]MBD9663737.1 PepSY domain-containing protein [Variovorax sp. VRV01]MDP9967498.1 putative iron-regulated membrane protein [Variovorax paradoxus]MDR6424333.1 putative iron-regulated membrane protein [Variovorax paradoxus]MDR6452393.1 putative iron-regulated membrane protein [Variovorax paradoxus]TWD88544.1 putative iron-regulated membrane protein [Variovorax beijingensis]